jgi:hypothetical protein
MAIVSLFLAAGTAAQAPSVEVTEALCLPNEANALVTATVDPEVGGGSVRLYFRRLNPVGAFYWVGLKPAGEGDYWGTFPKPEDREQPELDDEWWEVLQDRDWMKDRDREWLEDWLEDQKHEAAEYYISVYDAAGSELSRTETKLVQVLDTDECEETIVDAQQYGWAQNLTVGETTEVQQGRQVFHWLCDGIVTRINWQDIMRPDEYCRACVVAFAPAIIGPAAAGLVSAAIIEHKPAAEASPEIP